MIRRARAWWWKITHPDSYAVLKAFVENYELLVAERGWFLHDPEQAAAAMERRWQAMMYGEAMLRDAATQRRISIIDQS